MEEIWKEIPGYEDYYEVSNLGNFRSKDRIIKYKSDGLRKYPGKPLKIEQMQDGYCRIVLMKDGNKVRYMCHRLVAQTFIPIVEGKTFINHIDGNRSNNKVSNLEWCTQSENEQHSINILGKTMKGKTCPKKIKCIETGVVYKSIRELCKTLGNGACNEGVMKALKANRPYHNYTFELIQ